MRKAITVLAVLAVLLLSGCRGGRGERRYTAQFLNLFDTVTEVAAYAENREAFTEQARFIRETLTVYHRLYDGYHDYEGVSNIKTINENAGIRPVKVDRRIIELLLLGKRLCEETGGKMNPAMGSVLSVWHDYRTAGTEDPSHASLPSAKELEEAGRHTDISDVIIDEAASTVYLADPLMSLDVGAIGKGYAVEQTARLAEENGIQSALLSVGGNIRAIGTKKSGEPWKIGIQDPDADAGFLCRVELSDASVVTSGDYQRYYTVNGKRYHHIIDPETLLPADYCRSVSILCGDSGIADGLSTAVFNLPLEEGRRLIESLPDTEAVWAAKDGSLIYSSGFPARLVPQDE